MFPQGRRPTFSFGAPLTSVGKNLLIGYAAIYILTLVCEHWMGLPVYSRLALNPVAGARFGLWQLFTHPFIHDPNAPIVFLIDCLVFYFFAGTIEYALGTQRFVRLYAA
ncbi:MAG: hypothetical protein HKP58_11065, partial [Desulfatitalea sp.]|nr:hypothetical protein [Desulfatitalea sp.]